MKRPWPWKTLCYVPFVLVCLLHGCGTDDAKKVSDPLADRFKFHGEDHAGKFYIYEDTKTGRLYIGTSTGGYTEVNEEPLSKEVEK